MKKIYGYLLVSPAFPPVIFLFDNTVNYQRIFLKQNKDATIG